MCLVSAGPGSILVGYDPDEKPLYEGQFYSDGKYHLVPYMKRFQSRSNVYPLNIPMNIRGLYTV